MESQVPSGVEVSRGAGVREAPAMSPPHAADLRVPPLASRN